MRRIDRHRAGALGGIARRDYLIAHFIGEIDDQRRLPPRLFADGGDADLGDDIDAGLDGVQRGDARRTIHQPVGIFAQFELLDVKGEGDALANQPVTLGLSDGSRSGRTYRKTPPGPPQSHLSTPPM